VSTEKQRFTIRLSASRLACLIHES
jgi:hypothetical protein